MEDRDNTKKLCQALLTDLDRRLPKRNVLIVTHKGAEAGLTGYPTTFTMDTTHWGKVDGRNLWKDCDTCVVFGLPYLPDTWTANTFMAYQGPQGTEWLRAEGAIPFKGHQDIRQALKLGKMVTDVVQAVNRVRSRKVVDERGNCPPTDVYVMLPNDQIANELIRGITIHMPGIKVTEDWDYLSQRVKKRLRKSNFELALIKHLENMPVGSQSKGQVQKMIGGGKDTMDNMVAKAKDPNSELYKAMAEFGVKLESRREGRSTLYRYVKAE
jgi:hypothetical protein